MRSMGRSARRKAVGVLAGLAVSAGAILSFASAGAPANAATTPTVKAYRLSAGVKLTTIRYPKNPQEVRILTVLPGAGPRVDIATAGSKFPMWKLTSGMSSGNTGALAGVNGDFATPTGAPSHMTMIDGELWTTGAVSGMAFSISDDGQRAYVGHPIIDMKLTRLDGKRVLKVADWNAGQPHSGQISGYTQRGGSDYPPPGSASPTSADPRYCAVRLVPVAGYGYSWSGALKTAITRRYAVQAQPDPCTKTPLALGTDPGAIVLAARGKTPGAHSINSLAPGGVVRMWWSFTGWPGVTDVIGANPTLLDNGVNVAPDYYPGADNILWYNPRTSVGITKGCSDADLLTACKIFILTVDGRQSSSGWSKGMKLPALASELRQLGAWNAVNLDGGGSTAMWVKKKNSAYCQSTPAVGGCLVNRPSASTGERVTIDALTVLGSGDGGTPVGLR